MITVLTFTSCFTFAHSWITLELSSLWYIRWLKLRLVLCWLRLLIILVSVLQLACCQFTFCRYCLIALSNVSVIYCFTRYSVHKLTTDTALWFSGLQCCVFICLLGLMLDKINLTFFCCTIQKMGPAYLTFVMTLFWMITVDLTRRRYALLTFLQYYDI